MLLVFSPWSGLEALRMWPEGHWWSLVTASAIPSAVEAKMWTTVSFLIEILDTLLQRHPVLSQKVWAPLPVQIVDIFPRYLRLKAHFQCGYSGKYRTQISGVFWWEKRHTCGRGYKNLLHSNVSYRHYFWWSCAMNPSYHGNKHIQVFSNWRLVQRTIFERTVAYCVFPPSPHWLWTKRDVCRCRLLARKFPWQLASTVLLRLWTIYLHWL